MGLRINFIVFFSGSVKEWVDQMQRELITLADKATAGKSLTQV